MATDATAPMKPTGIAVGTAQAPKSITRDGKPPYVSITIRCPDGQYHSNIDCAFYGRLADDARSIQAGDLVMVNGEMSARAIVGRDPQKPFAVLQMFVRGFEVVGGGAPRESEKPSQGIDFSKLTLAKAESEAPSREPAKFRVPAPADLAKAVTNEAPVDDVPF